MSADLKTGLDFLVDRRDWSNCKFVETPVPAALAGGQVLVAVDRFALTSNNISYALAGGLLNYWSFFPAGHGWGRIPVMGYADVVGSAHPEVVEGARVFGFFPMSRYLVIDAERASSTSFSDAAAHRKETAPVYRQYRYAAADSLYDPNREDQLMLTRGLFLTSFLVDDFLGDADFFGAKGVVVSSASSKTSIALAYLARERARGPVIGLTSARNVAFVTALGCYDQVVAYGEFESLDAGLPVVFVDMAGNGEVLGALHRHYGDHMKYSCLVGATHWDKGEPPRDLPGAEPTFFFAPTRIQKRTAEWGTAGFEQRVGDGWRRFDRWADRWLRVVRGFGGDAVERTFREVLEGRSRPEVGHVLSLWGKSG